MVLIVVVAVARCWLLFVAVRCCWVFGVCRILVLFADVGRWCCSLLIDGCLSLLCVDCLLSLRIGCCV